MVNGTGVGAQHALPLLQGQRHTGRSMLRPYGAADVRGALFDPNQLDVEEERGVRRDHTTRPSRAIAEVRGDHEFSLTAHFHSGNSFIPPLDHLADADLEFERPPPVAARIELLAVLQGSRVVDLNLVAGL